MQKNEVCKKMRYAKNEVCKKDMKIPNRNQTSKVGNYLPFYLYPY